MKYNQYKRKEILRDLALLLVSVSFVLGIVIR